MNAKVKKLVLLVIVSLSFALSACKPADVVLSVPFGQTSAEKNVVAAFCVPGKSISNPDCK